MMRSLYSAVGGLRNHQTRMDVIGNNIANVNTTGYKGGRVNFQDILNQNIQGASGSQGNRGGTNPMQVGLGMASASIDTLFTNGSIQSTGVGTDLAISDAGFFILGEGNNRVYSRAGNFDFDNTGNYVSTSSGMKVMGWNATAGVVNSSGDVQAIKITKGQIMPASATSQVSFSKNLSADAAVGTTVTMPLTVFDSLGSAHNITLTMAKATGANTWNVYYPATTSTGAVITGGSNIIPPSPLATPVGTVTFNNDGTLNASTVPDISFAPATIAAQTATINSNFTDIPLTTVNTSGFSLTLPVPAATTSITQAMPITYPDGTTDSVVVTLTKPAGYTDANPSTWAVTYPAKTANGYDIGNAGATAYTVDFPGGVAPGTITPTSDTIPTNIQVARPFNYQMQITNSNGTTDTINTVIHPSSPYAYDGWTIEYPSTTASNHIVTNSGLQANMHLALNTDGTFNAAGSVLPTGNVNIGVPTQTAATVNIDMDFTNTKQVAGTSTVAYEKTGYAAGTLDSVSLNKAGEVVGTFSNGQNQVLAQVALAAFNNPGGLTKLGSNTYSVSANSGEPQIGTAATGGRGSLTPGALEMSNVDLSQQFSDMIVTQRGFQSNSKIITVSDEMLETLVNMKR